MLSHGAKQYVEQQVVAEATARGFRPAASWCHGDLWRSGLELGLWDTDTNPEGLRSHAKKYWTANHCSTTCVAWGCAAACAFVTVRRA